MRGHIVRGGGPAEDEPVDPDRPLADAARDSAALARTRRRAAWVGAGALTAGAALSLSMFVDRVHPWMQPFDDAWLRIVERHRTVWAVDLAETLGVIGSGWVTWPVRATAIVVLVARRRWTQLAALSTAIVLSELCIGPLKAAVDRPRPPSLVDTSAASFPSGHAIAASVTAFGLVAAFLPRGRRRVRWVGLAAVFAGSMAWSRTYLGAHWASDTIGGVAIGVGIALLSEAVFEEERRHLAIARRAPAD